MEVRKALDDQLVIQRRFGALCNAVQRFSPNGFNATFANLKNAVGATDPGNWTADQIVQAADLLSKSRVRYMHHRARWDEGRRNRKALGGNGPSSEEIDAFGDRSWFDNVSYSQKRGHGWGGLADWVRANELVLGPFGSDMEVDLRELLKQVPPAQLEPKGSILAHHGPFSSTLQPANVIEIPYRIYNGPITEPVLRSLSNRQRLLADCWFSRSHDGYVRERHLRRIVAAEEYWVVPYVLAALGDYVVEIVHEIESGLKRHSKPGSWHRRAYRQFVENNHGFITLVRQRATSYQHCYYSASYSKTGGGSVRPMYPAFSVLDLLGQADGYPRVYRLPRT